MNAPGEIVNGVGRRRCESPIELILLRAITEEIGRCGLRFRPAAQTQIGPYRVDILVEIGERRLVVECDGAAYHAANKEQVARDKQRDRFFAAHGISVMRFTGAEINRSPRACAAEVGAWAETAAGALKASIIDKHCAGEISRLHARRLIIQNGLVSA